MEEYVHQVQILVQQNDGKNVVVKRNDWNLLRYLVGQRLW
jgi:hypothetical protein